MRAPFGWTVILRPGTHDVYVYKRDCPADATHFAADLAPFTHATKAAAVAAAKRGSYAYAASTSEMASEHLSAAVSHRVATAK